MIIELNDEFIEHYGVLGMHWGVRNDGPGGGNKGPMSNKKKAAIAVGLGSLYVASVIATGGLTLGVLARGPLESLSRQPGHGMMTSVESVTRTAGRSTKMSDLHSYTFRASEHGLPSRPAGGYTPKASDFTRVSHILDELSNT